MSDENGAPLLRAREIAKSFPSGVRRIEVLRGIDLDVRAGESLSITGESGCGKTTLLNVLAGLETADSGALSWAGAEVQKWSLDRLAAARTRLIGMVFQAYYLVPEIDALGNVLLAARIAGRISGADTERARSLLQRVGLAERIDAMPSRLSGGERQRVAVARALMNNPRLILADEPTGNLDERTGNAVIELLLDLCAQDRVSLVLVTHNKEHARRTARQVVLHLGKLDTA